MTELAFPPVIVVRSGSSRTEMQHLKPVIAAVRELRAHGVFGKSVRLADMSMAMLIPWLNEEHVIGTVVTEFARAIPTAMVIVDDRL